MDSIQKPLPEDTPDKYGRNLSILNIGQILTLIILFIIICLQAVNLLFTPNQNITVEPVHEAAGYQHEVVRYQPETPAATGSLTRIADEPAEEAAQEPEILFVLGESGGKLAILSPDRQTVYEVFNVYISTLPDYDRDMLLEGIPVKTTEELSSLLEDFSS